MTLATVGVFLLKWTAIAMAAATAYAVVFYRSSR